MLLPMLLRGMIDGRDNLGELTLDELAKASEGIPLEMTLNKERIPNVKIGFFLHTPFPSSEIYRYAPTLWDRDITSVFTFLFLQDSSCPPRNPLGGAILRPHWVPHI